MVDPLSQYTRLFGQRFPNVISSDQSFSMFKSIQSDPIMKDDADSREPALMVDEVLSIVFFCRLLNPKNRFSDT
jgi:hypothetical protein